MPIYDNVLDYIFASDEMLENGWKGHAVSIRKRAREELKQLQDQKKLLIEDGERLVELIDCVEVSSKYEQGLETMRKQHNELMERINNDHNR